MVSWALGRYYLHQVLKQKGLTREKGFYTCTYLSGYLPRMLWKLICVTTQTHASMSSVSFLGLKDTGWVLPINFRKWWKVHWQFIGCQIWPTVQHIYKLLKDNSVSSGCEMEPITVITMYTHINKN
jgi:hypothetical protein